MPPASCDTCCKSPASKPFPQHTANRGKRSAIRKRAGAAGHTGHSRLDSRPGQPLPGWTITTDTSILLLPGQSWPLAVLTRQSFCCGSSLTGWPPPDCSLPETRSSQRSAAAPPQCRAAATRAASPEKKEKGVSNWRVLRRSDRGQGQEPCRCPAREGSAGERAPALFAVAPRFPWRWAGGQARAGGCSGSGRVPRCAELPARSGAEPSRGY